LLGLINIKKNSSTIYIEGKHPSFKDFIRIGTETKLSEAFSQWIRDGYALVADKTDSKYDGPRFWRFWSVGTKTDQLAWGVIRDSSDSIGRPYPLLILACNKMINWREKWESLPLILNGNWTIMEQIAVMRFETTAQLAQRINYLEDKRPTIHRGDLPIRFARFKYDRSALSMLESRYKDQISLEDLILRFRLYDNIPGVSYLEQAVAYCKNFKTREWVVPRLMFLGGSLLTTTLYLFFRPIKPSDFVMLWSI